MDPLTRLALEARDGDERSLEAFIRRSQAEVWRLVAHLVDRESADDVTQEVYLRAIPSLRRYRGDAPARTWLLSIARRTCADVIRRRARQRRLRMRVERDPTFTDPTIANRALGPELTELLHELDDDRRAAFVLTQVLGLPYAEAAEVLEVPVGTIRSRVARARDDLLRRHLADERDAAPDAGLSGSS